MDDSRLSSDAQALVFDVGETLVDESRKWSARAHDAGIAPFTVMGAIGALIERGDDNRPTARRPGQRLEQASID
ncbi:hypothetical protein [Gordonia sp. CPCC 205333]|uniref:hypothetical protein n=1 Tax=Gordonia sp. CPCC 205333 TaxID=3140790 RepID=UPI003AF3CCE3